MRFSGKTAVVTGAGSGIGLATARALHREGASVTLVDLEAPEFEAPGTDGLRLALGDVTDELFVARAMAQAAHGGIDYLVNAAGVLWFERDGSLVDIDVQDWDRIVDINLKSLKSVMLCSRAVVPYMRRGAGGALVHISSSQCLRGDPRPQDAYQAAKAGIIAVSKSLAIQLARDPIRSNVLIPGPTETPMQARWEAAPDLKAATADAIPLGRVGQPRDMANAILFLLSDDAAFITGTELVVDGGLLARP